jgi:pyruvate/2-oxoglutarate dehydrogenase complex dihydrolipoamide dehydrogenase (E3) component
MVNTLRPGVVILATGGIPLTVPFPGLEETDWHLASDLLEELAEVPSSKAFVIGGGLVGLETADFLSGQGKEVTLVEMLPDVGTDMDHLAKAMITNRLRKNRVTTHTNTKVVRLTKSMAIAHRGEEEIRLPIESVIVAVGVRANRELPDALAKSDIEMHVIGDAVEPRTALDAVYEGFEVACGL